MNPFESPAIVRDLSREEILAKNLGLRWWGEFVERFPVNTVYGRFVIPKGFMSDGASIPRLIWFLLSDTDPDILYPSYAHDDLYKLGKAGTPEFAGIDRKRSDMVIRDLMLAIGAPRWKANAVYFILRHFGDPWPGESRWHNLIHG